MGCAHASRRYVLQRSSSRHHSRARYHRAVHRFDSLSSWAYGCFDPSGSYVHIDAGVWDLRMLQLQRVVPHLGGSIYRYDAYGDVLYSFRPADSMRGPRAFKSAPKQPGVQIVAASTLYCSACAHQTLTHSAETFEKVLFRRTDLLLADLALNSSSSQLAEVGSADPCYTVLYDVSTSP